MGVPIMPHTLRRTPCMALTPSPCAPSSSAGGANDAAHQPEVDCHRQPHPHRAAGCRRAVRAGQSLPGGPPRARGGEAAAGLPRPHPACQGHGEARQRQRAPVPRGVAEGGSAAAAQGTRPCPADCVVMVQLLPPVASLPSSHRPAAVAGGHGRGGADGACHRVGGAALALPRCVAGSLGAGPAGGGRGYGSALRPRAHSWLPAARRGGAAQRVDVPQGRAASHQAGAEGCQGGTRPAWPSIEGERRPSPHRRLCSPSPWHPLHRRQLRPRRPRPS